jgi:heterogeneous nuclear ribonucleoprotein L
VYGLDTDKFNCQRLFNLLCLYGNVVKINFLKSKEGCAMAEYDGGAAVERACRYLGHTKVFGAKLRLEPSRKERVEDIRKPHEMPDGTDSFESFFRDPNNRLQSQSRSRLT